MEFPIFASSIRAMRDLLNNFNYMSEHFGQENTKVESQEKQPLHVFVEVGTHQLPVTFIGNKRFDDENDMYIGIDVEKSKVVEARQMHEFGSKEQRATFVQASAEQLPLKNESAEEMFFGNVFGDPSIYMAEKEKFLNEAERVLKQDGQLIIKETNTPLDIKKMRELLVGRPFREECVLTPEDKNWEEELQTYQRISFGGRSEYLMYLKKIAEATQ